MFTEEYFERGKKEFIRPPTTTSVWRKSKWTNRSFFSIAQMKKKPNPLRKFCSRFHRFSIFSIRDRGVKKRVNTNSCNVERLIIIIYYHGLFFFASPLTIRSPFDFHMLFLILTKKSEQFNERFVFSLIKSLETFENAFLLFSYFVPRTVCCYGCLPFLLETK